MALRLLVVLIVLGLLHWLPHVARLRRFDWFRGWTGHLGDSQGAAFVALALLPPLLLCLLVSVIARATSPLQLLWLVFAVLVLAFCFGPRELEADIDAVLKANDRVGREAAAQALRPHPDGTPLPFTAPALVEAAVWAGLQRRFAVLFWFLLLGPVGALGYRLARLLAEDRSSHYGGDAASRSAARRLGELLDWIPAHLMVFAMALVSDFDAVIKAWRGWHGQPGQAARSFDPGFLGAVARAGVDADVEAGDGYATDVGDPLLELSDARRLLGRVLVVWLAVAAVVVLASWFAP